MSITAVLSRTMKRQTIFIYPAIRNPLPSLTFGDQLFAVRPISLRTGSTASAIIAVVHTIKHLLSNNPCVAVIALDFSHIQ